MIMPRDAPTRLSLCHQVPRLALVQRWQREPLLHFLLLGAVLFGLYTVLPQGQPAAPSMPRLTVTRGDIAHLHTGWRMQWQRAPTEEELQGLIAAHIREEVLYREALALGLDRDDTIVRRRLAQKFEFLMQDLAAVRQPTDAELAAFFAAQRERYRVPVRLSLAHVYFSANRRGTAAERNAQEALAQLSAATALAPASELGDASLLDFVQENKTEDEIGQLFGSAFADTVLQLTPGVWQGPVASSYGWHLVQVIERTPAWLPELAEVQEQVRRDWADAQHRRTNEEIFQQLRARYDIVVEPTAPAAAAPKEPSP
jgi:hypothetical protein